MPAVSVILPTFNRAHLLPEAIESVLGQTYRDLELIVVDDGSTDETASVLSRFPKSVRTVRQARGGPSRARNFGMEQARGEFIAFIDSDDLWKPEKLELQLKVLGADSRTGAVCCDMLERVGMRERPLSFFERIGFTGELTPRRMFFANSVATPTLLARRSCLEAAGRFDSDLAGAEDYEYFFRLLRFTSIRAISRILVIRRLQDDALSRDRLQMALGTLATLERALQWFPELADPPGPVSRRFSRLRLDLGYARLLEGDMGGARRDLVRSLRRSPTMGRAWFFLAVSLLGRSGFRVLRKWRRSRKEGAVASACSGG